MVVSVCPGRVYVLGTVCTVSVHTGVLGVLVPLFQRPTATATATATTTATTLFHVNGIELNLPYRTVPYRTVTSPSCSLIKK